MNRGLKVLILFLVILLILICYFQYKSLIEIKQRLGLEYYDAVSYINFYLKSYEKAFNEKFNTLEDIDIESYGATLNEYAQIQNILPNSSTYKQITLRLAHNIYNLKGLDNLYIGTKAKIRNKILDDFKTLIDIYDLMAKEYDGNNLKYYKVLNDKNSRLNQQIDAYLDNWYDNYDKEIAFNYETIDSILRDNERIKNITWSPDKSTVLFMKADSSGYKAYLWRVGEETENFIKKVALNNYGFSWSPNNRYFLINEGLSLSTDKDVLSTIISSKSQSVKRIYHCNSKPIWSPIGNKLIMSMPQTDKKTKWDTLMVYDLEDDSSNVILKSYDSYYEPYDWSKEGIIGYYEIDNKTGERVEKTYNYDFSLEEKVYMLFSNTNITKEDRKKIISALPSINWKRYDKIVGGYPTDILNWIYNLNIEDEDNIINIIKAMKNSDGAYAEGINGVIVKTYSNNKIKFIKCLAEIPEYAETVGSCLGYDGYYKKGSEDINKDREMFQNSSDLTEEEKEIAKKVLEVYENYKI